MKNKFLHNLERYFRYGQNPLSFINILIFIYGLGIYSAKNNILHCGYPFLVLGITIVIAVTAILYKKWYGCLFLLFFIFILGTVRGDMYFQPSPRNIVNYVNQNYPLYGIIAEEPRIKTEDDQQKITYVVQAEKLVTTAKHPLPVTGKVYLHTVLPPEGSPGKIGDVIYADGKIKRITSYRNPGLIDQELAARTQGIYARYTAYTAAPEFYPGTHLLPIHQWAWELREKILSCFLEHLPADNAYILYAMLFGGYRGIAPETVEAFTATGIVHILSVSGSHISLLAGFILIICKLLKLKIALQLLILSLAIFLYALLCGFVPPVIRASVMGLMTVVALALGRTKDGKHLLSLTALVMLLVNPLLLFNISFQLSFAATAGLIYIMPSLYKALDFLPRPLAGGLALTLAAQLATAPLLAWYFNTLSLSSLLANLISVPILEFIILLGLNTTILLFILPFLAVKLLTFINQLLNLANLITFKLAALPLGTVFLPTMSIAFIVIYYLIIALLLKETFRRHCRKLFREHSLICLTVFSLACCYSLLLYYQPRPLALHFIDVGQGDAALIITPHRHAIVIDTGGTAYTNPRHQSSASGFDIGTRVIVPYLRHYGINKVDYLILSHSHADHIGGAAGLIAKLPTRQLILSDEPLQLYNGALAAPSAAPLVKNLIRAHAPQSFILDGVRFTVLYPPADNKKRQGNAASNVVKLSYGNFSALFTGDLEKEGEA